MVESIRLIIVDDFRIFRECLASFLAKHGGIYVIGSIADPEGALDEARAFQPDILLVNVNLDLVERLRDFKQGKFGKSLRLIDCSSDKPGF